MSDTSIDTATSADPHADKYNDPRAKITWRGIGIGIAVALFGALGAWGSIYGRRTRLEQTTRFWGDETIMALQLGERIELQPRRGRDFPDVELTGTPGLGHLRRALLDERNFDWPSETTDATVLAKSAGQDEEFIVTLRLTDPTAKRFETVQIDIDLNTGWIGHVDQSHCVRFAERKRSGLKHYLVTIMNKEKNRYDMREK